jgi:hypothetical protein
VQQFSTLLFYSPALFLQLVQPTLLCCLPMLLFPVVYLFALLFYSAGDARPLQNERHELALGELRLPQTGVLKTSSYLRRSEF